VRRAPVLGRCPVTRFRNGNAWRIVRKKPLMRFSTLVRCLIAATWDTIPPFSWCVIFSHINERSNSESCLRRSSSGKIALRCASMTATLAGQFSATAAGPADFGITGALAGNGEGRNMKKQICTACGKRFVPRSRGNRCCSEKCASARKSEAVLKEWQDPDYCASRSKHTRGSRA